MVPYTFLSTINTFDGSYTVFYVGFFFFAHLQFFFHILFDKNSDLKKL